MLKTIELKNFEGGTDRFKIKSSPRECPLCHTSIYPQFVDGVYFSQGVDLIQAVFRCTNKPCSRLFIGNFRGRKGGVYQLIRAEPVYPKSTIFSQEIQEVSPSFIEIYNQSMAAESHSLHQLTGIGLRKALEFLVKDFSIYLNKDQEEEIKTTPLSKCIETFIDDEKIKTCVTLATWLGNDETHYIRRWEDKDINDLKLLIKLTINWVENFLLTEKYTKEMSPKKNSS